MRKNPLAIIIVIVLSLILAGCGSKKAEPVIQPDVVAVAEAEETEAAEAEEPESVQEERSPAVQNVEQKSGTDRAASTIPSNTPAPSIPAAPSAPPASAPQPVKFRLVESDGTVFERDGIPQRIIVLSVPTAIIMDRLGIELVGITQTSRTLPPRLANLPEAGIPRDPNIEVIRLLNPDLVIISTDFKQMNKAKMDQHKIPTYYIDNQLYEDTFKSIEILGKAFGKETAANQLIREMRGRETQVLN